MKQRVFTILSLLSLTLAVAIGLLWVRSYDKVDVFILSDGVRHWNKYITCHGAVAIGWLPGQQDNKGLARWMAFRDNLKRTNENLYHDLKRRWQFAGFGISTFGSVHYFLMPLWAVIVLALSLPGYWMLDAYRVIRRARIAERVRKHRR